MTADPITDQERGPSVVCPCGADPVPGTEHCSPDCEPTNLGADAYFAPMRWTPDRGPGRWA